MKMEKKFEAIVIGAGVGGLAVGSLLAKDGKKVLILEQADRVGGRAMSIKGEEISNNGLQWYKDILASQYSYIADSTPGIETIIKNRMLDGYTLDIGYHAISANGAGYMLDFEELIGGLDSVEKLGADYASYYKGNIYRDVIGMQVDPLLKSIAKAEGINYLDFYIQSHKLNDAEIEALEKVSFQEWAEKNSIAKSDIIFDHLHTVSTLFSTINNPSDISIGDIFRYFKHAINPKLVRGLVKHVGGFMKHGTIEWSKAVARKFQSFGGELQLNAKVKDIRVENGSVTGVSADIKGSGLVEFKADIVISNIPAQQTYNVIDEKHFPAEHVKKTKTMYGYGSYVPYMGLNKLVMPEEHKGLGLKNTCIIPKEEGFDWDVYICWNIQSVVDPSVSPEGKYLYTAYLPITEKESLSKELVQKLVKRLPDFMEEVYPGFKESIDWKMDLVCWKLEGVAKSITQAGSQKVPVKSRHVNGLYFAGDTAKGYGVAMDCAIVSGVICAGEVLGKDFGANK
jgi:phytoene dehydrogenase-like protein